MRRREKKGGPGNLDTWTTTGRCRPSGPISLVGRRGVMDLGSLAPTRDGPSAMSPLSSRCRSSLYPRARVAQRVVVQQLSGGSGQLEALNTLGKTQAEEERKEKRGLIPAVWSWLPQTAGGSPCLPGYEGAVPQLRDSTGAVDPDPTPRCDLWLVFLFEKKKKAFGIYCALNSGSHKARGKRDLLLGWKAVRRIGKRGGVLDKVGAAAGV